MSVFPMMIMEEEGTGKIREICVPARWEEMRGEEGSLRETEAEGRGEICVLEMRLKKKNE